MTVLSLLKVEPALQGTVTPLDPRLLVIATDVRLPAQPPWQLEFVRQA